MTEQTAIISPVDSDAQFVMDLSVGLFLSCGFVAMFIEAIRGIVSG